MALSVADLITTLLTLSKYISKPVVQGGRMKLENFDPACLLEIARKNLPYILECELECGVPLNYTDENGQYVFRYKDGTILPASLDLSFNENWENHKRIMGSEWTGM